MQKNTVITIAGTGYVGLTTATVLANVGYKVWTIDVDSKKIKTIKEGKSYFFESGLDQFIKKSIDNKKLLPTTDYNEAIKESDIVFSCVGTPDKKDGTPNLDFIYQVVEEVAKTCKKNGKKEIIFVQKSTVPVGTGKKLIEYAKKINSELNLRYVSNPEFLREGSALYDTLVVDRIVIGSKDLEARDEVAKLFKNVNEFAINLKHDGYTDYASVYHNSFADAEKIDFSKKIQMMGVESAELVKVTANAFLSLKISFANSIAKLADATGANVQEVMNGVGADIRIGRSFLYPGIGWGGGCFPKDVSGLIIVSKEYGVPQTIMEEAVNVNNGMINYVIEKGQKLMNSDIKGKKIAVLGLSFKPGTSDIRKSPAIKLCNELVKRGAIVKSYDPQAMEEAKHDLKKEVELVKNIEECITNANLIFIATEWKEFLAYDWKKGKTVVGDSCIVDARNCLDPKKMIADGWAYTDIGRNLGDNQ